MPSLLRKPKYTLLDWFECHFDKAKEKKKKQHFPVILNVIVNTNTNGEHHIR